MAVFVASASWQLVLAGGGAFLGRVLTGSRGRLITSIASSILIGGLALHLLITQCQELKGCNDWGMDGAAG